MTGQRANQRSLWRSSAHPSKATQPRLPALVESQKDLESRSWMEGRREIQSRVLNPPMFPETSERLPDPRNG